MSRWASETVCMALGQNVLRLGLYSHALNTHPIHPNNIVILVPILQQYFRDCRKSLNKQPPIGRRRVSVQKLRLASVRVPSLMTPTTTTIALRALGTARRPLTVELRETYAEVATHLGSACSKLDRRIPYTQEVPVEASGPPRPSAQRGGSLRRRTPSLRPDNLSN
jgi:hypothetical protein